jgi:hypothetical protein
MPCRVQRFPHRCNRDGSYDSMCTLCFATVASSETEEELSEAEASIFVIECSSVRMNREKRESK